MSSSASGVNLAMYLQGWTEENGWEAFQINLVGDSLNVQEWWKDGGWENPSIAISFQPYSTFHTYTIEYHPGSVSRFYVDGTLAYTFANSPSNNLTMSVSHYVSTSWYGAFTGPTVAYVDYFEYTCV
eukprot:Phypoly_transcript_18105.p2 GENE.Phypoly_transcript_18105~~Phypoly_transcript_18105.p2  ORF type:complete len:127 (+),score=17.57 Phypoly_transcript_18105:357-737(+)